MFRLIGLSRLTVSCRPSWCLRHRSTEIIYNQTLWENLFIWAHLGDLDTPVQHPLSSNVVPVVSDVVQQAAVLHQLSHQLDWRCQADPQQTTHMRVIHTRHHIRLLHTQIHISVETISKGRPENNCRTRKAGGYGAWWRSFLINVLNCAFDILCPFIHSFIHTLQLLSLLTQIKNEVVWEQDFVIQENKIITADYFEPHKSGITRLYRRKKREERKEEGNNKEEKNRRNK